MALTHVGANTITDFDTDTSREAIVCRLHYPQVKDEVLTILPWRFAETQVDLGATLQDGPTYQFKRAFQLPGDVVKVIKTNLVEGTDWAVVGDTLFANDNSVKITYTKRVEDTSLFTPIFTSLIMTLLASRLVMAVGSRKASLVEALQRQFQILIVEGGAVDGQQGEPNEITDTSFLSVRVE